MNDSSSVCKRGKCAQQSTLEIVKLKDLDGIFTIGVKAFIKVQQDKNTYTK